MQADNRHGIRLMMLAMACFVINDALVKLVSQAMPAGALIMLRGLLASALVLVALRATGTRVQPRLLGSPWVLARAGIDGLATLAYLLSLFQLPLANATAINMATPLFITLLAVLMFNERVGALRWLAIGVGFSGVLLIVQPTADGFNLWSLMCLLGTMLHAARDAITRVIPQNVPSLLITLSTVLAVSLLSGVLSLFQGWKPFNAQHLALLASASVLLSGGYFLLIRAMRAGEMSLIAPFRYTGLLFALALGWLIWRDVPNPMAFIGIALLVGAGLFMLTQARKSPPASVLDATSD